MKRRPFRISSLSFSTAFCDISNTNCDSLQFIRRFPRLTSVNANNTLVSDLKGAPFHSTLTGISVANTPLADCEFCRLMLLCAISPNLKIIDGRNVTAQERALAQKIQVTVQPLLFDGFLITGVDPLKLTRGDETKEIKDEDLARASPTALASLKARQTVDMMNELSRELNSACYQLGAAKKQRTIPIDEILKSSKPVDSVELLSDNIPEMVKQPSPVKRPRKQRETQEEPVTPKKKSSSSSSSSSSEEKKSEEEPAKTEEEEKKKSSSSDEEKEQVKEEKKSSSSSSEKEKQEPQEEEKKKSSSSSSEKEKEQAQEEEKKKSSSSSSDDEKKEEEKKASSDGEK